MRSLVATIASLALMAAPGQATERCPASNLVVPEPPSRPLSRCIGNFSEACCSYDEYSTVQSQVSKLQLLFGSADTSCCTASFNYLFCQQTCALTANEFIDISPNLITSAPTSRYSYYGPAQNLTLWLCDDFCGGIYDACRNRQISGGQTVQQRYPLKEDFCAFVNTDNAAAQIGYVLGPIGCPAQGLRACGPYVQVRVRPANSSLPCVGADLNFTAVIPQCAASTGGNPVEDDSFVDDDAAPVDDDEAGGGGGGGSAAAVASPSFIVALGVVGLGAHLLARRGEGQEA